MRSKVLIETELEARRARARSSLPPEDLAEFDAGLAHIRDGSYGRAMLWSSLSPAQKRLVRLLDERAGTAVYTRAGGSRYEVPAMPGLEAQNVPRATVEKLVRYGLLYWAGPASEPSLMAMLTRVGRTVSEETRRVN